MSSSTHDQSLPANKLIDSTSPYLLQHAHNPVFWYPWGPEAIELARSQNKPIFLSIGYSACHWCHVMARESFENPDIAAIMNESFINIKVDREERPDLDELYMMATQLVTGAGGWPMSVWLTPDLQPFYAGTYFPPTERFGRHSFPQILLALKDAWANQNDKMRAQGQSIAEALREHVRQSHSENSGEIDLHACVQAALQGHADSFDPDYGGLGSSPKFPPSQSLKLWLTILRLSNQSSTKDQPPFSLPPAISAISQSPTLMNLIRDMIVKTLDGMMRGGIYDHVGGGFCRYSTDERWHVPHFEKMLYDNALLAPVYALAGVQFGRRDYERVARQTLDFWLRDMCSPEGAFYSALDADSEGEEGKYYLWSMADLSDAFTDSQDRKLIADHFGMTGQGNWHESPVTGASVLMIARTTAELAPDYNTNADSLQQRIDRLLLLMRKHREKRIHPATDDKILTSWNGLMISAMAICGRVLREPRYLEAAHRAIGYLLLRHMQNGRALLRVSRKGQARIPAFLEDHAFLLNGLMDLIDATSPTSLPGTMARKRALELADNMIRLFEDSRNGGFFLTHSEHDSPLLRLKNITDNATPSANAMAIRALLRLAQHSGKENYRTIAMRAARSFAGVITKSPSYHSSLLRSLLDDAYWRTTHPLSTTSTDMIVEGHTPVIGSMPDSVLKISAQPLAPLRAGDTFDIRIILTIADGYHIQPGGMADRDVLATIVRMRTDLPIASQEWILPDAQNIHPDASGLRGLKGILDIRGRCTIADAPHPGKYILRVTVLAQPCSVTSCLPPERATVEIPVTVVEN